MVQFFHKMLNQCVICKVNGIRKYTYDHKKVSETFTSYIKVEKKRQKHCHSYTNKSKIIPVHEFVTVYSIGIKKCIFKRHCKNCNASY